MFDEMKHYETILAEDPRGEAPGWLILITLVEDGARQFIKSVRVTKAMALWFERRGYLVIRRSDETTEFHERLSEFVQNELCAEVMYGQTKKHSLRLVGTVQ